MTHSELDIFSVLLDATPIHFFIQIGAHDGKTLDPIYERAASRFWNGVVVEPQPKIFAKLFDAYRGTNVTTLNCAIDAEDGHKRLYSFADNADLPYHATMLASFNRQWLEHNGHGYRGEIVEAEVECLSPKKLLKDYGSFSGSVDLLQIDTEGHDHVILNAFLDAECTPKLIRFENIYGGESEIVERLAKLGYGLYHSYPDTIAYRGPIKKQYTQKDFDELKP